MIIIGYFYEKSFLKKSIPFLHSLVVAYFIIINLKNQTEV